MILPCYGKGANENSAAGIERECKIIVRGLNGTMNERIEKTTKRMIGFVRERRTRLPEMLLSIRDANFPRKYQIRHGKQRGNELFLRKTPTGKFTLLKNPCLPGYRDPAGYLCSSVGVRVYVTIECVSER